MYCYIYLLLQNNVVIIIHKEILLGNGQYNQVNWKLIGQGPFSLSIIEFCTNIGLDYS